MKWLKKNQLSTRNISDNSVATYPDGQILLDSTNSLLVPVGTIEQRPGISYPGQMRYNTTHKSFEFFQDDSWVGFFDQAEKIINPNFSLTSVAYNTSSLDEIEIDSVDLNLIRSVKYQVQMSSSAGYHCCTLEIVHDGYTPYLLQYADNIINSRCGIFDCQVTIDQLLLNFTPTVADTKIVLVKTSIVTDSSVYRFTTPDISSDNFLITSTENTSNTLDTQILDTFPATISNSSWYNVLVRSPSGYFSCELVVVYDGTVSIVQYGELSFGINVGTFAVQLVAGIVEVVFIPLVLDTVVTIVKTQLDNALNISPLSEITTVSDNNFKIISSTQLVNNLAIIDSISQISYGSAWYQVQVTNSTHQYATNLLITGNSELIQYGDLGTSCGEFSVDSSANNTRLWFNPIEPNTQVNIVKTLLSSNGSLAIVENTPYQLTNDYYTISSGLVNVRVASPLAIDRINIANWTGVKYQVQITSEQVELNGQTTILRHNCELKVLHDSSTVDLVQYANTGSELGTFSAVIIAGYVTLMFTPTVATARILYVKTALKS